MKKLTPMMEQYTNIKKEYTYTLLFYRLGDFYELFFSDAEIASRELGLTLTGRDCGLPEKAPMCGVPYHAAESYITKLVQKGYKVAICEQVENPKDVKGIVKREVVRVVTPGTITDNKSLDENSNNYIMSIFENKNGLGFAVCDVTTGDFYTSSVKDLNNSEKKICDEIGKFMPKEIIVSEMFSSSEIVQQVFDLKTYFYNNAAFSFSFSKNLLLNHFDIINLNLFDIEDNILEICSSGALINYLKETQKNSLKHIKKIKKSNDKDYMILDLSSRRNLELTQTIRDRNKKGSLYWVLNKTITASGGRLLKSFVEQPLINKDKINNRLDGVSELKENFILREDLKEILSKMYDVERIISRIIYSSVNGRDLISLKNSLSILPEIKNLIEKCNSKIIKDININIDSLSDIFNLIEKSIKEDSPFSVREGSMIKKGYNSELDEIHEIKNSGTSWLLKIEADEREKTNIKNLKIKYNKVFGYYLEVTKSYLSLVPDTYIRKQTLANCERYITEDLKIAEDKILSADGKIVDIEYHLFMDIVKTIEKEIGRIQKSIENVSLLDVLISFATIAENNNYSRPIISTNGIIEIKNGRHPVVEKISNGFIPNDTYIDKDETRLAIITGPNMAGKSTYMRQVALISVMAQIGSFIPADSGNISIVDRIFTRVGASDDLATGQSTFMVEMSEVANILANATPDSLLILDEIGRGTSTFDGLSIAWSILEYIADKNFIGAKTLFATHYHELTDLEGKVDGVKNYSIKVQKQGDDIIFLRKIERGSIDHSYGIHVAKLAGIPDNLINRSKQILKILETTNSKTENEIKSNYNNKEVFYDNVKESTELLKYRPLIKELKNLDVDNLTAKDAINKLYILKDMIN